MGSSAFSPALGMAMVLDGGIVLIFDLNDVRQERPQSNCR